jgi:tetratricopeptide (TPR) repeat protein/ribosomal protein L40E
VYAKLVLPVFTAMALGAAKWLGKTVYDRVKKRVKDKAKEKTEQIVDRVLDPIIGPEAKPAKEMTADELKKIIIDALCGENIFTRDEASTLAEESLGHVKEEIKELSNNVDSLRNYIASSTKELYEHISISMADQLDEFKVGLKNELRAMNQEQAAEIISAINEQLAPFEEKLETIETTTRETKEIATITKEKVDTMFNWMQTNLSNVGEPRTIILMPVAAGELPKLTGASSVTLAPSQEQELQRNLKQLGDLKALAPELVRKHRQTLQNLGTYYFSKNMLPEALETYSQVTELDPDYAKAWNGKGAVLAALGRFEEAGKCIDEALRRDPRDAYAWINRGNTFASLGKYEEALKCYDEVLRLDTKNVSAWTNKGNILNRLGRFEEAIGCLDEALRLDAKDASAWSIKGSVLGKLGRFEEAVDCLDEALRLDTKYVYAWISKGATLDDLGRFEEAVKCYDEALRLDMKNVSAWINKGTAFNKLGRFEEAVKCFDEALRLDAKSVIAWYDKGTALSRLGRFGEALKCYDEALRIDSKHVPSWNNKGITLGTVGRFEEAIECLNQALRISPTNEIAIKAKKMVEDMAARVGSTVPPPRQETPTRQTFQAVRVPAAAVKYCTQCGTRLPKEAAFCTECGSRQTD